MNKITTALISVSDKTWITTLGRFLADEGVSIYATTNTLKELRKKKIKAEPVTKLTRAKEILGGRVKTLDFKLYAGILADVTKKRHQQALKEAHAKPINLLVVNFYPFHEKVKAGKTQVKEALEFIDIGGVSLVRAGAKNYKNVVVLVDPEDYKEFIREYKENNGIISEETRLKLAFKAFSYCAKYDQAIFNYFSELVGEERREVPAGLPTGKTRELSLSENLEIKLKAKEVLRYGENPHQRAVLYELSHSHALPYKILQGKEMSFNNFQDAGIAFKITALPYDKPYAACIVKHQCPCGVAIGDNQLDTFIRAKEGDPVSAFGGIIGVNFQVDEALAEEITKSFFEVIISPSFSLGALQVLAKKRKMRVVEIGEEAYAQRLELIKAYNDSKVAPPIAFVKSPFGVLAQEEDLKIVKAEELEVVSDVPLRAKYKDDVLFGLKVVKFVKSNGVVIVKNQMVVGIGAGQTSRVDATKLALDKAKGRTADSVLVSDGFFPFADSVEFAASEKVAVIVAPSGSIRDHEIVQRANDLGLCLVFVPFRQFYH